MEKTGQFKGEVEQAAHQKEANGNGNLTQSNSKQHASGKDVPAYEVRYNKYINEVVVMNPELNLGSHEKFLEKNYFLQPASSETDQEVPISYMNPAHNFPIVVQLSFPRSGCQFLRAQVSEIFGIYTGYLSTKGSYMDTYKLMISNNLPFGNDPAKFFYSVAHYPFNANPVDLSAQQAVVLVRNPFNCIESYFKYVLSKQHQKNELHASQEMEAVREKYFRDWQNTLLKVWQKEYDFLLNLDIPTLIIRYEDLMTDIKSQLTKICAFAMHQKNLEGTVLQEKINRYSPKIIYEPSKSASSMEIDEASLAPSLKELLSKFGYLSESSPFLTAHNEASMAAVCNSQYQPKKYHLKQPKTLEEFGQVFGEEAKTVIAEKEAFYLKLQNMTLGGSS